MRRANRTARGLPDNLEKTHESQAQNAVTVEISPRTSGVRLVFDDTDVVYPVTVDPLTTSAAWSAKGGHDHARFGISVATAGDVNGDGYSDGIGREAIRCEPFPLAWRR